MNKLIPAIPYEDSRFLSVRVDPQFHKELRRFAVDKDASVSAVIKAAVQQYITQAVSVAQVDSCFD